MAPIKSTAFGYSSSSSDKVETDNNIAGIGATYSTSNVSEPGNGYRYLYYTSPGILTVTRGGNVDVAVIAGGGSGGGGGYYPPNTVYAGGGGGAGGVFQDFNYPFPIGEYTITVGNGGGVGGSTQAPTSPLNRMGNPGQPSTIIGPGISSITAVGGGAGGSAADAHPSSGTWPGYWGDDGGSGGGNGWIGPSPQYPNGFFPFNGRLNDTGSSGNALVQRGPSSTPGYTASPIPASPAYNPNSPGAVQGYPAGNSQPPYDGGASGGGGAGGPSGTPDYRHGGDGVTLWTNDPGIPPSYGTPGPTPGRWFAGGGGAGDPGSSAILNGGAGGGGTGMDYAPSSLRPSTDPQVPGVANTGGGGGGGHSSAAGAVGGSGIVIIRYKIS